MAKSNLRETRSGRSGGMCCDHCSDTKYPCALWEKRLKGDEKAVPRTFTDKNEGAATSASD